MNRMLMIFFLGVHKGFEPRTGFAPGCDFETSSSSAVARQPSLQAGRHPRAYRTNLTIQAIFADLHTYSKSNSDVNAQASGSLDCVSDPMDTKAHDTR